MQRRRKPVASLPWVVSRPASIKGTVTSCVPVTCPLRPIGTESCPSHRRLTETVHQSWSFRPGRIPRSTMRRARALMTARDCPPPCWFGRLLARLRRRWFGSAAPGITQRPCPELPDARRRPQGQGSAHPASHRGGVAHGQETREAEGANPRGGSAAAGRAGDDGVASSLASANRRVRTSRATAGASRISSIESASLSTGWKPLARRLSRLARQPMLAIPPARSESSRSMRPASAC